MSHLNVTFSLKNGAAVRVNFAEKAVPAVMTAIARHSWLDKVLGRNSSISIFGAKGEFAGCIRISEIASAHVTE